MSRLSTTNNGFITSIAGISIPRGCSAVQVKYANLSDSQAGRGMDGTMWPGIFAQVRTLSCNWNGLRPDQIQAILSSVKCSNGFDVTWYDPESGSYQTSQFYAGDRTADVKCFYNNHELIGLQMNLIEITPYR